MGVHSIGAQLVQEHVDESFAGQMGEVPKEEQAIDSFIAWKKGGDRTKKDGFDLVALPSFCRPLDCCDGAAKSKNSERHPKTR